jgi:hypothetical protein
MEEVIKFQFKTEIDYQLFAAVAVFIIPKIMGGH